MTDQYKAPTDAELEFKIEFLQAELTTTLRNRYTTEKALACWVAIQDSFDPVKEEQLKKAHDEQIADAQRKLLRIQSNIKILTDELNPLLEEKRLKDEEAKKKAEEAAKPAPAQPSADTVTEPEHANGREPIGEASK